MLRLHNCNIIVLDGIFNSSEVKCIKSKKLFKQVIDLYSECKLLNIEIYTLQGDNSQEGMVWEGPLLTHIINHIPVIKLRISITPHNAPCEAMDKWTREQS